MARLEFLAMKTEKGAADLIGSGLIELKIAAEKKLMDDTVSLGGLDFVTSFLGWVASFAAIYLLILDRTEWRTDMKTSLLAPYLFISLPRVIFEFLRGECGQWISLCVVLLGLFRSRHFPEWLKVPGALALLVVAAPSSFVEVWRDLEIWCFIIGCHLMDRHVKFSGGYRNSFTQSHAIAYSLGFVLLILYPFWSISVSSFRLFLH